MIKFARLRKIGRLPMKNFAKEMLQPILVAIVTFALLGTVAALWENPVFVRMTPAGPIEVVLLAGQSILLGLFFALPRSSCGNRQVGIGSILAFLGIACPVCNKILLFIFGSELLLVYFEPVRIYVAAAGFLLTAGALWLKRRQWLLAVTTGADEGARDRNSSFESIHPSTARGDKALR